MSECPLSSTKRSDGSRDFHQRWSARSLCVHEWNRSAVRHDAQAWQGYDASTVPYCTPLHSARLIHVHRSVAKLYQCADSRSSTSQIETIVGYTFARAWNDAGMTWEVSFHGHSQVNVDLDVAVADATILVPPQKR